MNNYIFSKEKIQDENIAFENLIIVNEILTKNKAFPFLLYGTLLGIFRDRKLIKGDNDIDIGCNFKSFIINKKKIIKIFCSKGFFLAKENRSLITLVRKNEHVDLYLFRKIPFLGGFFSMNFYIPRTYLSKFEKIKIYGNKFLVPQQTEFFLKYCYGDDWKIPKKGCTAKTSFLLNLIYFVVPRKVIKIIGKLISN
jgi:phosphorylcholine metabolism protein LicD